MKFKFKFNEEDELEIIGEDYEAYARLEPEQVAELHLFLESRNEQAFKYEHEKIMQGR